MQDCGGFNGGGVLDPLKDLGLMEVKWKSRPDQRSRHDAGLMEVEVLNLVEAIGLIEAEMLGLMEADGYASALSLGGVRSGAPSMAARYWSNELKLVQNGGLADPFTLCSHH